jgi:DNA-binding XRE family transcriptional regulator
MLNWVSSKCKMYFADFSSWCPERERVPSLDPVPDHVLVRRRAIGQRIRDARVAAKLTQEKLGEQVDLTRVTIGNIEQGNHSPLLDSLLLISDALGVPLWQLIQI